MKLGMSLYSYGADLKVGRMTVKQAIDHAASLGVTGIELIDQQHLPDWPHTSVEQILEFKDYVHSRGMEICNFSAYVPDMIRSDRKATLDELVQMAKDRIVIAHLLGAPLVRPLYFGSGFSGIVALIQACIPTLDKYGLVWGIEIHAPFKPMQYLEAYNSAFAGSKYVKTIPDFSCWETAGLPSECGAEPVDSLRALVPISGHVHGKAHVFDSSGEEPHVSYKNLMGALHEGGFQGYIVCEYEGWLMNDAPSREMAARHVALIKRYL